MSEKDQDVLTICLFDKILQHVQFPVMDADGRSILCVQTAIPLIVYIALQEGKVKELIYTLLFFNRAYIF